MSHENDSPAKVAKAKPIESGNVWYAEPEIEPMNAFDYVLLAMAAGALFGFWLGVYQYFAGA